MVFPSLPAYLDPTNPANWQQRPAGTSSAVPTQPQPQPQPPTHGSIRPGSMAERARMANIALPQTGLKCPRCDSTNTKFCYFNNYNLSQPRHFCKTCRRYWTRGGALRNVPVGGGCRRNKRTKSSNNTKSSSSTTGSSVNINTSSSSDAGPASSLGSIISSFKTGLLPAASAGHDHMLSLRSPLPSSSLRLLNDFPNAGEISLEGLGYGAVSAPISHWFPGTPSSQLPLLGSLDISSSPFQHSGMEQPLYAGLGSDRNRPGMFPTPGNNSNNPDLNIQFIGNHQQQLWGGGNNCSNSWTDVSNFTSSSSPNNNNAL